MAPVRDRLEHDGLEALLAHDHSEADEHSAEAVVRNMRVRLVYRLGDAGPNGAQIFLAKASLRGSTSPYVVVDVGSMPAAKAENSRQLTSAVEDEKHLCVEIDSDQHQAIAAACSDSLPSATRTSRLGSTSYGLYSRRPRPRLGLPF